MNLKNKLAEFFPPGADIENPCYFFLTGLLISTIYSSILFFSRLAVETRELYEYAYVAGTLRSDAVMTDFSVLCESGDAGFAILFLTMPFFIINFYSYFYRGGRPIYVMKRIPSASELHRRCLVLPIAAMLTCAVLSAVLTVLYFAVYLIAVPNECIPPSLWQSFLKAVTTI